MEYKISESFKNRAQKEWSKIAKEELEIKATEDWIYAYGSELGILRLYWAMRGSGTVEKRDTNWVYFKEIKFS